MAAQSRTAEGKQRRLFEKLIRAEQEKAVILDSMTTDFHGRFNRHFGIRF